MFSDFIYSSVNSRVKLLWTWLFWLCPNASDLSCCLCCPYNNNKDYYYKMMEYSVSDYANNKPQRNPSILHAHKQQNKFPCMHVKQQFIPFLFQTGLEGKLIQQSDSWLHKVSVSISISAKVLVYCSGRYLGCIAMSLILLVFTTYPLSKKCLIPS